MRNPRHSSSSSKPLTTRMGSLRFSKVTALSRLVLAHQPAFACTCIREQHGADTQMLLRKTLFSFVQQVY